MPLTDRSRVRATLASHFEKSDDLSNVGPGPRRPKESARPLDHQLNFLIFQPKVASLILSTSFFLTIEGELYAFSSGNDRNFVGKSHVRKGKAPDSSEPNGIPGISKVVP